MMTPMYSKNRGFKLSALVVSFLFIVSAFACGKNETEQVSKSATKTVEKVGETVDKVTEKTKAVAGEAVKTAGEMVDKASDTAKDAYDAAGNVMEKTAEKASDTYKAAGEMVDNAASSSSKKELSDQVQNKTEEAAAAAKDSVEKTLDKVPSMPDK